MGSLRELKRVDVGVLEAQAETNGLAGELGEVGAFPPGDFVFEFVAEERLGVVEGEAVNGFALRVAEFEANPADGVGGVIDEQAFTGEDERAREHLA